MFLKKLFHVAVKVATWIVPPVAMTLISIFTGFIALPIALAIGFGASYAIDRMHTFSLKAENLLEKQQRSYIKHALVESLSVSETKNNSPRLDIPKVSSPRPIPNLKRSHSSEGILSTTSPTKYRNNTFYRELPPKRVEIISTSSDSSPNENIGIKIR